MSSIRITQAIADVSDTVLLAQEDLGLFDSLATDVLLNRAGHFLAKEFTNVGFTEIKFLSNGLDQ